jgi:hypothetical protein
MTNLSEFEGDLVSAGTENVLRVRDAASEQLISPCAIVQEDRGKRHFLPYAIKFPGWQRHDFRSGCGVFYCVCPYQSSG